MNQNFRRCSGGSVWKNCGPSFILAVHYVNTRWFLILSIIWFVLALAPRLMQCTRSPLLKSNSGSRPPTKPRTKVPKQSLQPALSKINNYKPILSMIEYHWTLSYLWVIWDVCGHWSGHWRTGSTVNASMGWTNHEWGGLMIHIIDGSNPKEESSTDWSVWIHWCLQMALWCSQKTLFP